MTAVAPIYHARLVNRERSDLSKWVAVGMASEIARLIKVVRLLVWPYNWGRCNSSWKFFLLTSENKLLIFLRFKKTQPVFFLEQFSFALGFLFLVDLASTSLYSAWVENWKSWAFLITEAVSNAFFWTLLSCQERSRWSEVLSVFVVSVPIFVQLLSVRVDLFDIDPVLGSKSFIFRDLLVQLIIDILRWLKQSRSCWRVSDLSFRERSLDLVFCSYFVSLLLSLVPEGRLLLFNNRDLRLRHFHLILNLLFNDRFRLR